MHDSLFPLGIFSLIFNLLIWEAHPDHCSTPSLPLARKLAVLSKVSTTPIETLITLSTYLLPPSDCSLLICLISVSPGSINVSEINENDFLVPVSVLHLQLHFWSHGWLYKTGKPLDVKGSTFNNYAEIMGFR